MRKILPGLAFFLCLIALSCKKEPTGTPTPVIPSFSGISITNAAIGTGTLDFLIDDQVVGLPDSLTFGTTVFFDLLHNENPQNPLSGITPYLDISYGFRTLSFKTKGILSKLASLNQYFLPGAKYSVFAADSITHGQIQYVLLKDNLAYPDSTKSQVRFVNLSPDAPAMDVYAFPNAGPNGFLVFSGRSFLPFHAETIPEVEKFLTLPAGPYYFIATESGTANILQEGGLILPSRTVVTIYARGLLGGTGANQLTVGVIEYLQ
jgi:hypothetical protein